MFKVISKLYRIKLLRPKGIFFLLGSFVKEGTNLMVILRYSSRLFPKTIAIHDFERQVSYKELYLESKKLASILKQRYQLKENANVAILCKNHIVAIQSLFALSRLGMNVYLLNVEMSASQIRQIINQKNFSLFVYDEEKTDAIEQLDISNLVLSYHESQPSINGFLKENDAVLPKLKRTKSGKIIVLTGGTTGQFKSAARKPSIKKILNPFLALLLDVHIDRYRSVYVATPIYHGFGLTALIVSLLMGGEMFLPQKYQTEEASRLISNHQIQIIVIVPLMLRRLLHHDKNALASVRCIISGGAALDPELVKSCLANLGNILFNLYGTSEAGFSIMAGPDDLQKNPSTIGRPIRGVKVKIVEENRGLILNDREGIIFIKSHWVMDGTDKRWISTGDIGCVDENGYYYLRGRRDGMIVSGGENVYPEDLESELLKNEYVEYAAVIGISDAEFGQRLKAYVVLKEHKALNEDYILNWLSGRVARYQMPVQIIILEDLPITLTGKIDRKRLAEI